MVLAVSQNIYLVDPQLCEKAKEIAKHLGISNFKASKGYLDRWKCNVKRTKIKEESGDVRGEAACPFMHGRRGYLSFCKDIRVRISGTSMKLLVFGRLYPISVLAREDHSAKVKERSKTMGDNCLNCKCG